MKATKSQPTYLIRMGKQVKEYTHARIAKKLQSGDLSPDHLTQNRDGIWRCLKITQGFRKICSRIAEKVEIPACQLSDWVTPIEKNIEPAFTISDKILTKLVLKEQKKSGNNSNPTVENLFKSRYWSQAQLKKTTILIASVIVLLFTYAKIQWTDYSQVKDDNSEKRKIRADFYDKALNSSNKKMLLSLLKTKI
jgi:hypothetical protein